MSSIALHVTISAFVAYPLLSLIEYVIHRHFMHKTTLARVLRAKYFADTFRNHTLVHHSGCFAIFDREKSKCAEIDIRVRPLTLLVVMTLPCVVALAIDPTTSIVLAVGAILNGCIWSEVHDEMHRPKGAWFARFALFMHLKRRHYLHHRHQNRNFNTLFPMWDWIFGTTAVETNEDLAAMRSSVWRVRPLHERGRWP